MSSYGWSGVDLILSLTSGSTMVMIAIVFATRQCGLKKQRLSESGWKACTERVCLWPRVVQLVVAAAVDLHRLRNLGRSAWRDVQSARSRVETEGMTRYISLRMLGVLDGVEGCTPQLVQ